MNKYDLAEELKDLYEDNLIKAKSQSLALQWTAYALWEKYHKLDNENNEKKWKKEHPLFCATHKLETELRKGLK